MPQLRGVALVCSLLIAWSSPAIAQEQGGSIQGIVKDASGAVLPGVTVEARSPSVVGVSTTTSDSRGEYRFPALPSGVYEITANIRDRAGLKRMDRPQQGDAQRQRCQTGV